MKKKIISAINLIVIVLLAGCITFVSVYAASWISKTLSQENTISIGSVEVELDKEYEGQSVKKYFSTSLSPYNGIFAPSSYEDALDQVEADNGATIADAKINITRSYERLVDYSITVDDSVYGNNEQLKDAIKLTCYKVDGGVGTLTDWDGVAFDSAGSVDGILGMGTHTYHLFVTAEGGMTGDKVFKFDLEVESSLFIIPDSYTVKFDPNGGIFEDESPLPVELSIWEGSKVTDVPTVLLEDYNFVGWFTEVTGGEQVDLSTYIVSEDITLYAQWTSKTYTLTLSEGCGVTFADGSMTTQLRRSDPIPDDYINNTGRTISGWYNTADTTNTWTVDSLFSMPTKAMEIAPYFAPEDGAQALIAGSAKSYLPDYYNLSDGTTHNITQISGMFSSVVDVVGGELGRTYLHNGTLGLNSYIRLVSTCGASGTEEGIIAGNVYKFQFHLTNKGNAEMVFELLQVQTATNIELNQGAATTGDITLAPGETTSVSLNIKLSNNDSNALTVVYMKQAVENMKLGISMSKLTVPDTDKTYTVTLAENSGVTFAGGEMTAELLANEVLPEIINTTGRTIAGWYNGNSGKGFVTASAFRMPAADVKIYPYFEKLDGYIDVVPLNAQRSGTIGAPSNQTSGINLANFVVNKDNLDVNDIVVKGGDGGYAELGKTIHYKGTMAKDQQFRANTIVDANNTVVKKGVVHTFRYNFENKGTQTIDLRVNQVNSVRNIEAGDTGHYVLLAPGESMELEFSISFTFGEDNYNALTLFTVNNSMNGMYLVMSMSVRLGT